MKRTLITIPAWLLLAGCVGGARDLASAPRCEDTPTVITLEEVSELGFSGAETLALAEGAFDGLLSWHGDDYADPSEVSTSPVHVSVAYAEGEVRLVASQAVYPEGDAPTMDLGLICEDYLEVDVSLVVTTEDGGLDESYEVALRSFDGQRATAYAEFDHGSMGGSYDYAMEYSMEVDSVTHSLEVSFDEAGCGGELVVRVEGCYNGYESWDDCTTRDCDCWSSSDTVASWSGEAAE